MKTNEDGSSDKGAEGESQTPEAIAFENALRQILTVSKEEVLRREKAGRVGREPRSGTQ